MLMYLFKICILTQTICRDPGLSCTWAQQPWWRLDIETFLHSLQLGDKSKGHRWIPLTKGRYYDFIQRFFVTPAIHLSALTYVMLAHGVARVLQWTCGKPPLDCMVLQDWPGGLVPQEYRTRWMAEFYVLLFPGPHHASSALHVTVGTG